VQRSEYKRWQFFHATGSVTGRTYRVLRRRAGSVQAIDGLGRPSDAFCTVLPESAPIEDQMLAQKFMLETDEPGFLELAGSMRPTESVAATSNDESRAVAAFLATARSAPSTDPLPLQRCLDHVAGPGHAAAKLDRDALETSGT
jgi:hypothetical protein